MSGWVGDDGSRYPVLLRIQQQSDNIARAHSPPDEDNVTVLERVTAIGLEVSAR